jgi:hypothetical protein
VTQTDAAKLAIDVEDSAKADAPECEAGRMAVLPLRLVPHEVNGETQLEGESS